MSRDEHERYDDGRECPALWQLIEFAENAADADEAQRERLDEHL